MNTLFLVLLMAIAAAPAGVLQDPLEEAKAQYASAAYEDALSTLKRATAHSSTRVEVEQYRAFCLIALGRMADAERAVAALVDADPRYVPSASVASPRVLTLVAEMRKKELPAVARRLLDAGRAAFTEKDFARATETLGVLLPLLDDPALKGRPETEDLRILAQGFATLAEASAAPPPPAPAAAPEPAPEPPVRADMLTAPVPVLQEVPVWVPPNPIAGSREYNGAIRVRIGGDGRVISAVIEKPTYPSYDARLLQASKEWVYKPALRNGLPVESERVIPIQLRPKD
jgi:hypothetical protein